MRVAAAFPAILLLFAGCGSGVVAPEDADPRLQTSVVPGEGWVRVERPGFSFLVPPGFEKTHAQPIDSDAANYVSGTSSLHHDYGWYTGRWSQEEQIDGHPPRDVIRESVSIGGKTAELVAFRYGSVYVVRAWWGRVARSHGQDVHLLVRGETEDPAARARLLASLYSVRFD